VFAASVVFVAFRESLARSRAGGVPFASAWEAAMADVPMGPTTRLVLRETRSGWARAYAGHLTDADRRLLELAGTDRQAGGDLPEGILIA
jgi:hypothetical protein